MCLAQLALQVSRKCLAPRFTTDPIATGEQAISSFALGAYNLATQIVQATIQQGSTIVFGTAAAQSGQAGGGTQLFVQMRQLACVAFGIPCPLP